MTDLSFDTLHVPLDPTLQSFLCNLTTDGDTALDENLRNVCIAAVDSLEALVFEQEGRQFSDENKQNESALSSEFTRFRHKFEQEILELKEEKHSENEEAQLKEKIAFQQDQISRLQSDNEDLRIQAEEKSGELDKEQAQQLSIKNEKLHKQASESCQINETELIKRLRGTIAVHEEELEILRHDVLESKASESESEDVFTVPDHQGIQQAMEEYLNFHRFIHTVECFSAEAETIRIRDDFQSLTTKEKVLQSFDCTHDIQLFELWEQHVPAEEESAHRLEFQMRVYMATCGQVEADEHARMHRFKLFLESTDQHLAQTTEFCPFYALPYASSPETHPSFKHIFTQKWQTQLRTNLSSFLDNVLGPETPPILETLFLLSGKPKPPLVHETKHQENDEAESLVALLRRVVNTLATRNCSSLSEQVEEYLDEISSYGNQKKVSQVLRVDIPETEVEKQMPFTTPTSPKSPIQGKRRLSPIEFPILPDLNYLQIKNDLIELAKRTDKRACRALCLILQALRWRISRTPSWRDRERVILAFVQADILGINDGSINTLLGSSSSLVVEYVCRLLNFVASHGTGRRYIRSTEDVMVQLQEIVEAQKSKDTIGFQNALGTLQKLSVTRSCAQRLIECGMLQSTVNSLLSNSRLCEYSVDYSMALLMNLCLYKTGREAASETLLQLLETMLMSSTALVYVTGILYSLLRSECYLKMFKQDNSSMTKALRETLSLSDLDHSVKGQLKFILDLIDAKETNEHFPTSPGVSEDDEEEEELIPEDDAEEHPELRQFSIGNEFARAAELVGDHLLMNYYAGDKSGGEEKEEKHRKRSPIPSIAVAEEMQTKDRIPK